MDEFGSRLLPNSIWARIELFVVAHTELLDQRRLALGLTQAEVAERLGASPSYMSAVEAGRRNLTLGQLANVANAMRVGIDISFIRPDGKPVRVDQT